MKSQDKNFFLLFLSTIFILVFFLFLAQAEIGRFYKAGLSEYPPKVITAPGIKASTTGKLSAADLTSSYYSYQKNNYQQKRELAPAGGTVDNINVAAYYLTGWGVKNDYPRSQDLSIGTQLHPLLGKYKPVDEAGTYDAGDPEIAAWHISWAREYGIDTFVVPYMYPDWEWEKNLESGLLAASNVEKINFALQYDATPHLRCDGEGESCVGFDNLIKKTATTVAHISDHFFDHPSYLKKDQKPVLFVYHAHVMFDKLGREKFDKFIKKIRENAPQDLFLVGGIMNKDWLGFKDNIFLTRRFDAVTSYNMPALPQGYSRNDKGQLVVRGSYESLVEAYIDQAQRWSRLARSQNRKLIPPLLTGFSNRQLYEGGYNDWLAERTQPSPEAFARMVRGIKNYIDPQLNMVVVCAWNEFQEGAALEPTSELGFSYLQVLKDVLGD